MSERLPVQTPGVYDGRWFRKLGGERGKKRATVARVLAEAAWEGYDADGHGAQSCARLHERGGFSLAELGYYLARAVDEGRVEVRVIRDA